MQYASNRRFWSYWCGHCLSWLRQTAIKTVWHAVVHLQGGGESPQFWRKVFLIDRWIFTSPEKFFDIQSSSPVFINVSFLLRVIASKLEFWAKNKTNDESGEQKEKRRINLLRLKNWFQFKIVPNYCLHAVPFDSHKSSDMPLSSNTTVDTPKIAIAAWISV